MARGGKKTWYLPLNEYEAILHKLIREKQHFTIHETSYTKKIDAEDCKMVFNEEGRQDINLLALINKVRQDAALFTMTDAYKPIKTEEIQYFGLSEAPIAEAMKIDVRGAYWEAAMKMDVISPDTNDFLLEKYPNTESMKRARLKALGSLATRKVINVFEDGRIVETSVKEEFTRPVYSYICSVIDDMMKDITMNIKGAFYYYWDCVFAGQDASKEVMEFILDQKYAYRADETIVEVVKVLNKTYLLTKTDKKMYLIKDFEAQNIILP